MISSATRFFAYGHAGLFAACCLSAPTRPSPATSTTTPLISLRAANAASLSRSVPPAGSGSAASSATFDESVKSTVFRPEAATAGRDVSTVSVTPTQVVTPFVTVSVNGRLVSKAPPRPVTRT